MRAGEGWGQGQALPKARESVGFGGEPLGFLSPSALGVILLLSPTGSQQLQLPGGEGDDGPRAQCGEWHQQLGQTQPGHYPMANPVRSPPQDLGVLWSPIAHWGSPVLILIGVLPWSWRCRRHPGLLVGCLRFFPSGIHGQCLAKAPPAQQGQGDKRLQAYQGEDKFSQEGVLNPVNPLREGRAHRAGVAVGTMGEKNWISRLGCSG